MKLSDKELRTIFAKPPGQLTADDLRWLRPDQLERLTLHQVAGLTPALLLGMKPKQIAALTQEQVAVLSLEQMGLVPKARRKPDNRRTAPRTAGQPADSTADRVTRRQWTLAAMLAGVLPLVHLIRTFSR